MKTRIASVLLLTVCCLMLAVTPATAGTYSSGPPNGNIASWSINFGGAVSDSYTLVPPTDAHMLDFVYWDVSNTDLLRTVDVQFGSSPFGGSASTLVVALNTPLLGGAPNTFGFYVFDATIDGLGGMPPAGWMTLSNACTTGCSGPNDPTIGWDECTGGGCAGQAFTLAADGGDMTSIPAESFSLTGPGGTTPEPSSIILLGSGILGVAGVLRRRLMR